MSTDLEHEREMAQDALATAIVDLLTDLRDVGLFATGADLPRSPSRHTRTEPAVDAFAATTSALTLLASNGRRKGAIIYNDSPAILYVKLGGKASTTDWSLALNTGDSLTVGSEYRGPITAVFSAAGSGQVRVTEFSW